jgi:hypothetical protein
MKVFPSTRHTNSLPGYGTDRNVIFWKKVELKKSSVIKNVGIADSGVDNSFIYLLVGH